MMKFNLTCTNHKLNLLAKDKQTKPMKPKIIKRISNKLLARLGKDYVAYNNLILPAKTYRLCGVKYKDDDYFLASAQQEAERLVDYCGLEVTSHILDVGCGAGRLAIGILNRLGPIKYYQGVDVNERAVRWCQKHISRRHPTFQFSHLDARNPRYNPDGAITPDADFRLLFPDHKFDIIYLYSVFSHLLEDDIRGYLKEFRRVLTPAGRIFLTGFIEEDVPEITVNPDNYRHDWKGPLHGVRYDKAFFVSLLEAYDFQVTQFDYETEPDGQSGIYVSRKRKV
jgi:SAM-dependent methyltransferase